MSSSPSTPQDEPHEHDCSAHGHSHASHNEPHEESPWRRKITVRRGADDDEPAAARRPPRDAPHNDEHGHSHGGQVCTSSHNNSHSHSHEPRPQRPVGTRPAETGGHACQLDLEILLPGEADELGRMEKLEAVLEARSGISDVHLRRDGSYAEVCVHYDHTQVTLAQVVALVQSVGGEVSKRYRQQTWFVLGLESAQNGYAIEQAVRRLSGVLSANVAYAAERLVVEYDSREIKLRDVEAAVKDVGFELEAQEAGHVCSYHAGSAGLSPKLEMPLAVTSGLTLVIGWLAGAFFGAPPMVSTALFVLALASGGFFAVRGALMSLRQGIADIETLMVLAGVGAAMLGAWFEGAFLLFLFSLGHALEHRAMEKARRAIEALGELRPETARVRKGAEIKEIGVDEVQLGDLVIVRPGDRVPLDGVIRSGESTLDQATITGESVSVARGVGDSVFAGTINTEAALGIEVTKLSGESVLARIVDMVSEAEAQKSPTQRFAKKIERTFVPAILVLAPALTLFLYFVQHLSLNDSVLRGISLLVAASPCALAIATPAAVLSAVARAARGGVLIKGGAHLETLGKVQSIAFDKTGTLTLGKPKVVSLKPAEGVTEGELLSVAAAAESHSSHPLAEAVVAEAEKRGLQAGVSESCEAVHGKGLRSVVGGVEVVIGNMAMFAGEVVPEAIVTTVRALEEAGQTTMIVRREGTFLGVLGVADTLRPEAKASLQALHQMGIRRMVMLSGDNQIVAKAIAAQVGLDEARAPLMPEAKVDELRKLAKEGGVAMVGDGVNDAPALAVASVGIAMGGTGSDVALETADLVLMSEGLGRLPFAVRLARKATAIIQQNLIVALGVSAVLVLASIFGWVGISQAVVLHEGSTLVVVANGLRLLRSGD